MLGRPRKPSEEAIVVSRSADMAPSPPPPARILRSHTAQINTIVFSPVDLEGRTNERLYTGDADGIVIITSTRTFRALASWKAHEKGLLGIQEWEDSVITYVCARSTEAIMSYVSYA